MTLRSDSKNSRTITVRCARESDVPTVLGFIRELAEFEKLSHEVVATEAALREHLFGSRRSAEVLIAEVLDPLSHSSLKAVGFALFFHNFSTFLAQPGLYLEDLYVPPTARNLGVGKALLKELARIALERRCGRMEWAVLDWNSKAIEFYEKLGARAQADWSVYRMPLEAITRLASSGGEM